MKMIQYGANMVVITDDRGILHLFSYESEILRYNPRNKDITVYTNVANYSVTTKRHVRNFCTYFLDDPLLAPAIFDPKERRKGYKILHIINE